MSCLQPPKIKETSKPMLLGDDPNIEAHQKRVLAHPAAARALAEVGLPRFRGQFL